MLIPLYLYYYYTAVAVHATLYYYNVNVYYNIILAYAFIRALCYCHDAPQVQFIYDRYGREPSRFAMFLHFSHLIAHYCSIDSSIDYRTSWNSHFDARSPSFNVRLLRRRCRPRETNKLITFLRVVVIFPLPQIYCRTTSRGDRRNEINWSQNYYCTVTFCIIKSRPYIFTATYNWSFLTRAV